MIDFTPTLQSELSEILPTYYEAFCNSKTVQPCITYQPHNNYNEIYGNTLVYSNISYYIKIWGNLKEYKNLIPKAKLVDTKMRELGFNRISYGELCTDLQVCIIMLFEGTGKEDF